MNNRYDYSWYISATTKGFFKDFDLKIFVGTSLKSRVLLKSLYIPRNFQFEFMKLKGYIVRDMENGIK